MFPTTDKATARSTATLLFALASPLVLGCGSKKEEEGTTTADLCREECGRVASECPAGSFAVEGEDFCRIICVAYIDSADCREKYQAYTDCTSMREPVCNFAETIPCEAELEPFFLDGTDENNNGECVQE